MEREPVRGDVVRSTDPFKSGRNRQRPWLVVSNDRHPFADEQCVAAALTTTSRSAAHPLYDEYWETGGTPVDSLVLPWALHSVRFDALEAWQGRLVPSFVDRVVDEAIDYLEDST